jgi:hypothetical protein
MDCDGLASDILEDPLVGRWRAAYVVLRLKAIYRNDNVQVLQPRPSGRERPERASHNLNMDASTEQERNERLELTISDERIATHERKMKRLYSIYNLQNAVHQSLAFPVA